MTVYIVEDCGNSPGKILAVYSDEDLAIRHMENYSLYSDSVANYSEHLVIDSD